METISNSITLPLESNERFIDPITTWVNGILKISNVLALENLTYSFRNEGSIAQWIILEVTEVWVEPIPTKDGTISGKFELVRSPTTSGECFIPAADTANWMQDDQVIFNYVVAQLGLQFHLES